MPAVTGETNCTLKKVKNGLAQWIDKSQVKCTNPVDNKVATTTDKCVEIAGAWQFGEAYARRDQQRYRTLGHKADEVTDAQIRCLNREGTKELTGRKNCWAYYVEGSKVIDRLDQYTWLSLEGVECKNAADAVLTGPEKCKITKTVACGASQIKRLALKGDEKCIGTFTWGQKL